MERGGGLRKMLRAPTDLVWPGRARPQPPPRGPSGTWSSGPSRPGTLCAPLSWTGGTPKRTYWCHRPLRESRSWPQCSPVALMLISEPGDPVPRMLSTPVRTATYPVAHAAAEALGAWQARVPQATLPALQTKTSWSAPTGSPAGALPAQLAHLGSLGTHPGPKPHPPGSLGCQGPREGLAGPELPEIRRKVSPALPPQGVGRHRHWAQS